MHNKKESEGNEKSLLDDLKAAIGEMSPETERIVEDSMAEAERHLAVAEAQAMALALRWERGDQAKLLAQDFMRFATDQIEYLTERKLRDMGLE